MHSFSLIVATIGRYNELASFLDSILAQNYPRDSMEVLICDQNADLDIRPLIAKYQASLMIRHYTSPLVGLSLSRNIGIRRASNDIIAFPDDDCTYYPDTLSCVSNFFSAHSGADIAIGRIFDRVSKAPLLRNWPECQATVSLLNFYNFNSSITLFARRTGFLFDERFGVGAHYGAGEDADYIHSALRRGARIIYTPTIEVKHPEQRHMVLPLSRVYSYSFGVGALFRKWGTVLSVVMFCSAVAYHLSKCFYHTALRDKRRAKSAWISVKGRVVGYFAFRS